MNVNLPNLIVGGSLLYFGSKREKGGLRTAMMIGGVLGLAGAFRQREAAPATLRATAIEPETQQARWTRLRSTLLTPE